MASSERQKPNAFLAWRWQHCREREIPRVDAECARISRSMSGPRCFPESEPAWLLRHWKALAAQRRKRPLGFVH